MQATYDLDYSPEEIARRKAANQAFIAASVNVLLNATEQDAADDARIFGEWIDDIPSLADLEALADYHEAIGAYRAGE